MVSRIRVKLKSYDAEVIDKTAKDICNVVKNVGANVVGPIPLPTKIKRYTVLRSPHIDKDSREHFEYRLHRRLIDIIEPSQEVIDALLRLEILPSVDVEIKQD
ncbi:MAG: 30S ribosomal protein S10 [Brevinematales bacterium]|nr:30S ribosomal protein S10 [Brevinematales bacterium]